MYRIHLVGLGAIGAAHASRILDSGQDVKIVVDAGRAERYRAQRTRVNGVDYDFDLVTAGEAGPADLVLIAVKFAQLDQAIELVRGSVGESTVILSLLNGISSEDVLAQAFPQAAVPLAISVGIDAVRHDRDVHYSSLGRIVVGQDAHRQPASSAVGRAAEILAACGIDHLVSADMVHQLWWKFLINVGVNQVSAVLGAPYRVFQEPDSPARAVMIAAQREVIAVGNACGVPLSESDLEAWLDVLAGLGPDNYTSMAQDALAGRPTEVDIFAGTVCRLGAVHGVATPVNETLRDLLLASGPVPAPVDDPTNER